MALHNKSYEAIPANMLSSIILFSLLTAKDAQKYNLHTDNWTKEIILREVREVEDSTV